MPNFRPDTGRRRWTLIQVAGSVALRGGAALLSPLRCSGSRLLYMAPALRCARFQPSGVPQKRGTKSCACFLCLPRLSGSGIQELDRRTFPGCGAPSALRVPSPSPRPRWPGACLRPVSHHNPPGRCRPSRISGGLWLKIGGLSAVW